MEEKTQQLLQRLAMLEAAVLGLIPNEARAEVMGALMKMDKEFKEAGMSRPHGSLLHLLAALEKPPTETHQ
ncbi:hypothetical protein WDZ92_30565 [Nostoc sp. NIES-2111]